MICRFCSKSPSESSYESMLAYYGNDSMPVLTSVKNTGGLVFFAHGECLAREARYQIVAIEIVVTAEAASMLRGDRREKESIELFAEMDRLSAERGKMTAPIYAR
jgi:hypothetical protein